MSDETKQRRFVIIKSLNGTDITQDIVIKYIPYFSVKLLNFTCVLFLHYLLHFR